MKYIDADKLIAEIYKRREDALSVVDIDKANNLIEVIELIEDFQQEQPLTTEKVVEQCKKFGGNPEIIYQEQPEVDLKEEAYMRGFAQGAKEERERILADIIKMRDTAENRGLNFGAVCGFQIALDELEQRLTGKH
jgi:hypothetical protein